MLEAGFIDRKASTSIVFCWFIWSSSVEQNANTAAPAWLLLNELYELTTCQTWITNVMLLVCKSQSNKAWESFISQLTSHSTSVHKGHFERFPQYCKGQWTVHNRRVTRQECGLYWWWNYLFLDHSHLSFLYLLGFLKKYGIRKSWLITDFQQYSTWRT